jgi:hypothetical protein
MRRGDSLRDGRVGGRIRGRTRARGDGPGVPLAVWIGLGVGGGSSASRGGDPELQLFVRGAVPEVGVEFRAVLVEREGVPEGLDGRVGSREGETAGDEPDGDNGIPVYDESKSKRKIQQAKVRYQTPTNSISTSMLNAFLNKLLCDHPTSSARENILYAKGTCWWLHAGRSPTLCIIPASARAVYAPRENPNIQMRSPAVSIVFVHFFVGRVRMGN